jgi:hypothetical protein
MKKLIFDILMAVCSVCAFSERMHCYRDNDIDTAYYNVDNKGGYFTEEEVYDLCVQNGCSYYLVEDVQLSEESMGVDYIHYLNATKYASVAIKKDSKWYGLYWLGYREDYMGNKYHTFAWSTGVNE